MADPKILVSLQELQKDSGKCIPDSVITGMTLSLFTHARYQLIRACKNPSGVGFLNEPTEGISFLPRNTPSARKLKSAAIRRSYSSDPEIVT